MLVTSVSAKRPAVRGIAVAGGVMVSLFAGVADGANRQWLPPVQVSHVDTLAAAGPVALSRSGPRGLHATVFSTAQVPDCLVGYCCAYGDYLFSPLASPDWTTAWSNRRRFTWDLPDEDPDNGPMVVDFHMAADAANVLHLAYEQPEGTIPLGYWSGYKNSDPDDSGWAVELDPPTNPNPAEDFGGQYGPGPNMCIEETGAPGVSDDLIHIIIGTGTFIPRGTYHTQKLIVNSTWDEPTLVTNYWGSWGPSIDLGGRCFGPPNAGGINLAMTVSSGGDLQLIGQCKRDRGPGGDGDATRVLHLRCRWETDHWSIIQETVLDTFDPTVPEPEGPGVGITTDIAVSLERGIGGEYVHAAYRFAETPDRWEVHYRRYDVNANQGQGQWEPAPTTESVRISSDDGVTSLGAALVADLNGNVHVIYHEGEFRPYYDPQPNHPDSFPCYPEDPADWPDKWRNELRYVQAVGDPTIASNWTAPVPITADMRTAFTGPSFVAEQDTIWTLFTAHDDDDFTTDGNEMWKDGTWEAWFRKSYPIDGIVSAAQPETLSGVVALDQDLVVEAGATLTIAPGTVILAKANQPDPVKILVLGCILAEGTEAKPIRFGSFGGEGAPGEWGGILFQDTADTRVSTLSYCRFVSATVAVAVDSIAPTLTHPVFVGSQTADIFVDRDTRISVGSEWALDSPVTVKMPTASASDFVGLNPGKVDVLVDGLFGTQRPEGGSGWVIFTSTVQNPLTGDDWGGIRVNGSASIRDADVGYAIAPIFFSAATSAEAIGCRVHHYGEQGILDWGSDARIERCRVERGSGLLQDIGTTGIRLVASVGSVQADTVLAHRDYGVRVEFTESYCNESGSAPPETLRVCDNVVLHDVEPTQDSPTRTQTGISLAWLCRNNWSEVTGDSLRFWEQGLELFNCSDAQVSCERVRDNYVGIQYERNTALPGIEGPVYLYRSHVRSNYKYGLRIPMGIGLIVGGYHAFDPIGNTIQLDGQTQDNPGLLRVDVVDPDPLEQLDARQNCWQAPSGSAYSTAQQVRAEIESPLNAVRLEPVTVLEVWCPGQGPSLAAPQRLEELASERPSGVDQEDRVVVGREPSFAIRSRPGGFTFTVRKGSLGTPKVASVKVYDVTGRRVASLWDGPIDAASLDLEWGNRAEAPSGIYFIRMESPERTWHFKVAVVR